MTARDFEFTRRPSEIAYTLKALSPPFLRKPLPFPAWRVRWRAMPPDPVRLERFLKLTGLRVRNGLPLLFPQVITYPLQMVILTHPSLPLSCLRMLQVRNDLLQHRPIPVDARLDAEVSVIDQRIMEKDLELDLHTGIRVNECVVWEGISTYLFRGRFAKDGTAMRPPPAPADTGAEVAGWRTESGGGLQFSRISGDTNGIHYWDAYARMLGFKGAIHHPHVLVGQCVARLPEPPSPSQRLELWFKGPIYYDSEVGMSSRGDEAGVAFSLKAAGSGRPALVGRLSGVDPGTRPGRPAR